MQKLMYFLFGLITALFAAVMIIEHQGIYFFDEEVYGLLYTDYWNYWYYSKVVIIALFIFCVLSFVYTLGSRYKDKDDGYKEIRPS